MKLYLKELICLTLHISRIRLIAVETFKILLWKTHITNIVKKANSTLGFLRRNLKYCPEECKRLSYIALVRSTLEYGAIVWDPYKLQDIQSIEKIQRQAARCIKMTIALAMMVAYVKCFGTLSYNRYSNVDQNPD